MTVADREGVVAQTGEVAGSAGDRLCGGAFAASVYHHQHHRHHSIPQRLNNFADAFEAKLTEVQTKTRMRS